MNHLAATNRKHRIIAIPCDELHYIVPPKEFIYEPLEQSILKEGMREPLAVVDLPVWKWRLDQCRDNPVIVLPDSSFKQTDRLLRVQRGNNRLYVAKWLGYETIDCVVFEDILECCLYSEKQRGANKAWQEDLENK